jgi:hypothetical protein
MVNRIKFAVDRHRALACLIVFAGSLPCSAASILVGTVLDGIGESTVGSVQALAQGFTLNQTAEVIQINLEMSGFGVDQFTLWLTNAIGPSTTQADVLFQTLLTFPSTGGVNSRQTVPVATSLLRLPGSYFLVLSSSQTSFDQGLWDNGPPSILPTTTGTAGLLLNAVGGAINTSFPPASSFPDSGTIGEFQIVGNPVPESSTSFLVLVGFLIVLQFGILGHDECRISIGQPGWHDLRMPGSWRPALRRSGAVLAPHPSTEEAA